MSNDTRELVVELARLLDKQVQAEAFGNTHCFGNSRRPSKVLADAVEFIDGAAIQQQWGEPVGRVRDNSLLDNQVLVQVVNGKRLRIGDEIYLRPQSGDASGRK